MNLYALLTDLEGFVCPTDLAAGIGKKNKELALRRLAVAFEQLLDVAIAYVQSFFHECLLFAGLSPGPSAPTASTDGITLFISYAYIDGRTSSRIPTGGPHRFEARPVPTSYDRTVSN